MTGAGLVTMAGNPFRRAQGSRLPDESTHRQELDAPSSSILREMRRTTSLIPSVTDILLSSAAPDQDEEEKACRVPNTTAHS